MKITLQLFDSNVRNEFKIDLQYSRSLHSLDGSPSWKENFKITLEKSQNSIALFPLMLEKIILSFLN